ncbi:DNA methyltransferase [Clostridioides sp. ZZV15-6597]|uniref:DNA-methyltransferase n=1 Tax=Clostridioides sp. ZZV15-6597 TaxID=2811500 RepID=UPI001D12F8C0|nr:hypothetical protein [Clostridioides sp. ZZV15-6597]
MIFIETNKIYNIDCIEYMKTLPDECVDLIIADPPYYKILKETWDNQWDTDNDYFKWCCKWIKESKRILKQNGSMYIWNWFDNICEIGHICRENDFYIRNLICWNRGGGRERNNWGSKKEDLLYISKTKNPIFNLNDVLLSADDINRKMSKQAWERGKYERKGRKNYNQESVNPSNVWYDSILTYNSKEKVNHPSQKPLSLCNKIIKASSNENDLVYIPFAGSGSEIISCIKNNRNYIATEINNEYIEEIIIPRIKNLKESV